MVRVRPIPGALSYEVQYASIGADGKPGPWTLVPPFTKSRPMPVNGLTPGTAYSLQVRALGKLGYTEWSSTATRIAT